MSIYVLVLLALLPFGLVALLFREADIDIRQALFSAAAILVVLIGFIGALLEF
jgi:hypothetical protein